MDVPTLLQDQWKSLLQRLPESFNLEKTLRDSGALQRRRAIGSAETLLRLALVWSLGGLSLRATAAWAQVQQVAQLSDVALLKRLRNATPWLGQLLAATLAHRVGATAAQAGGRYRLRIVDATTVTRPGSRGTDYRIHLGWDPSAQRIHSLEVTGPQGGESLGRHDVQPGDLFLADRGYAHRPGLAWVREQGGDFLIRINWQNLPLQDGQGSKLEMAQLLLQAQEEPILDLDVWTVAKPKQKIASFPARLLVIRRPEQDAERDRQKIVREASRKGRTADARTLLAAGFFLLLTSVSRQELAASKALELYRLRWQIEMAFKRFKGLLDLGQVPAKDPQLAQSYLFAKLLAALLLEDLTQDFLAFSP